MGICKNCGFKVKYGEWYATDNLHLYCCTSADLRKLREEGERRCRESVERSKKGGGKVRGTHFGSSVDEFCLEM